MPSIFACGTRCLLFQLFALYVVSLVEGEDVDKNGVVDFIGISLILFLFHQKVYVFVSLSVCTFRSKSHGRPKRKSNIHKDHITPNFVLVMTNLG